MKKKLLALALTAVMVGTCLVGCGESNEEAKTDGTSQQTEQTTEDAGSSDAGSTQEADNAGTDPIQNLIEATTDTVKLRVWAAEEDQDVTKKMVDEFKSQYEA